MSAPCNIPAIRHAVSALHGAADDGADTRRYAETLQEAGAAIDELVSAMDARRALSTRIRNSPPPPHSDFWLPYLEEAQARVDAALHRVKAGAP